MNATFTTLFDYELRALNRAETRQKTWLRAMAMAANYPGLRAAFTGRLDRCDGNIRWILNAQSVSRSEPPWRALDLLEIMTADGDVAIDSEASPSIIDLALIADARRVSYYLLARYQTAAQLAAKLRRVDAAKALTSALFQENEYETRLSQIWSTIARKCGRAMQLKSSR